MSYLVLARRFRPQDFDEIVGQEHVTRTLKNAIHADRVAHAFLFTGARGVGKTTAARVFAKALNCVNGPTSTPCGTCDQCRGIAESRATDVQEIDGASNNSVEDVRALRETIPYLPSSGRFKIYIVDEVHMLTTSAFNALLKTLEEPPSHVKFIFATTEPHKIPVTILSRCQRYDFRLIPTPQIQQRLRKIITSEEVEAEPAALSLLAREAAGSMRDALSLLDQALAFNARELHATEIARLLGVADRQLLLQISQALIQGDAAAALRAVESAATFGCDLTRFSHDLLRHLRNLVVARQCPEDRDLIDVSEEEVAELAAQVEKRDVAELHRLFLLFSKASEEIARSPQPRLLLEMTLARLATLEPMISLAELAQRLEQLGSASPAFGGPSRPVPPTRKSTRGTSSRRAPPPRPPSPPANAPPPAPSAPIPRDTPPVAEEGRDELPPPEQEIPPPEQMFDDTPPSEAGAEGDLQRRWKEVLDHLRQTSPSRYHTVVRAIPLEVSPSRLRLQLPDEPFFRDEAADPSRREALAQACVPILGAQPDVRLEIGAPAKPHEREHIEHAAREQDRRREVTDNAIVRATLREFKGATIEQIRLYDEEK